MIESKSHIHLEFYSRCFYTCFLLSQIYIKKYQEMVMQEVKKTIMLNETGVKDFKDLPDKVLKPHFPVNEGHRHYKSSGVTIGIGIDLGNRTASQIEQQFGGKLDKKDLQLLKSAAGLKGKEAQIWTQKNKQHIKLSRQSVQQVFDAELQSKDKTLKRIFSSPEFKAKFGVDGRELLNKMELRYKIAMYDSLYVGRNTVETRGKMIPILAKIYKGEATPEDYKKLDNEIIALYNEHPHRQKVISCVLSDQNKYFSGTENISKLINSDKASLAKDTKNVGGVDLSYNILQKRFNGFCLSDDYIKMHASGGNSPTLRDLIVPLKVFYDATIQNKNISISIDPHVPTDPNGPFYEKIYYPAEIEGTYFAQIMVEADYIMKQLKMGVTRQNKPFNYPEALKRIGIDFKNLLQYTDNPQERTRQWIVIRDVEFQNISSEKVQIGEVKMGIQARVQVIGPKGTLIDTEQKPSLHTQRFCELFTKYYDLISQEYKEFKILKRLAKATVIAQVMRRQGCRIDEKLIDTLFERQKKDKSPKIIPRMSNCLTLSPKETPRINIKGDFIRLSTIGGCELNFKIDDHRLDLSEKVGPKEVEAQFFPFIFQETKTCDEEDCLNLCSNGYRSIKDSKCSVHTKYICCFCLRLMRQGGQYIQLADEKFAHKDCLKCEGCYQNITGEYVTFQSLLYHRLCIPKISVGKCYVCNQNVHQTQKYFINHKGHLHQECSHSFKCKICAKVIDVRQMRTVNEDNYHKDCIICEYCSKPIIENSFKNLGNKFAHVNCVPTLTCKSCNKEITAAGVTFGNNNYHSECLKCYRCGKQLNRQLTTDNQGKFYHPTCAY